MYLSFFILCDAVSQIDTDKSKILQSVQSITFMKIYV